MRRFFRRLSVVPFEAAIGAIALYSGLVGLLHLSQSSDALNLLLPGWFVIALQITYLVAGFAMLYGAGRGRGSAEVFGLILVGASLIVRSVALFWFLGVDALALNAIFPNAVFLAACASRYRALAKGVTLVRSEV